MFDPDLLDYVTMTTLETIQRKIHPRAFFSFLFFSLSAFMHQLLCPKKVYSAWEEMNRKSSFGNVGGLKGPEECAQKVVNRIINIYIYMLLWLCDGQWGHRWWSNHDQEKELLAHGVCLSSQKIQCVNGIPPCLSYFSHDKRINLLIWTFLVIKFEYKNLFF